MAQDTRGGKFLFCLHCPLTLRSALFGALAVELLVYYFITCKMSRLNTSALATLPRAADLVPPFPVTCALTPRPAAKRHNEFSHFGVTPKFPPPMPQEQGRRDITTRRETTAELARRHALLHTQSICNGAVKQFDHLLIRLPGG